MAAYLKKGDAVNLICLNLSKGFDRAPQGKLLLRNEKTGINLKKPVRWIKSLLK